MLNEALTAENAVEVAELVSEMFKALPRTRQPDYVGHWNTVLVYIAASQRYIKEAEAAKEPKKDG